MKQNAVVHVLLGVAVLLVIVPVYSIAALLVYLEFAAPDQSGLSTSQWVLFATFALVLSTAIFGPTVRRRLRGLPSPQPLSPSDIRFSIGVAAVLCPVAFFAVWMWGAYGSLVIMLVPIAFIFQRRGLQNANDGNAPRGNTVDPKPPGDGAT